MSNSILNFNESSILNAVLQETQKPEEVNQHELNTLKDDADEKFLGYDTGYLPSRSLPIRTARYWQDVEMGQLPEISFYIKNAKEQYEIHKNATNKFPDLVDLNAFHQVLKETAFELSLKGESDIALFFRNNNKPEVIPLKIKLIRKQYFPNGQLRYYHGLINFDQGSAPWIMTKKWFVDKDGIVIMTNNPYERKDVKNENGEVTHQEWKEINIEKFNDKYKQDFVGSITYGKVPFPVITLTNTGADRNGSGTSDTAEVKDLLLRLDNIEDAIDRATRGAKTRLYTRRKNGAMHLNGQKTKNYVAEQIKEDVELIEIYEDPHTENGSTQISDRKLDAAEWTSLRTKYLQEYFAHTGESVAADAHGNNQHTYEVQSKGDNKYRRATAKRTQRQFEIITIIATIIEIAKVIGVNAFTGMQKISVNINETDIRKDFQIEDRVQKLLDMGIYSKVQARMRVDGIDEITAIKLLTAAKEHDEILGEEETTPPPVANPEITPPNMEDLKAEEEKE